MRRLRSTLLTRGALRQCKEQRSSCIFSKRVFQKCKWRAASLVTKDKEAKWMHCHALLNWLGSGASSILPYAAGMSVMRMCSSIPAGWLCANCNDTLVWAKRTVNVKLKYLL